MRLLRCGLLASTSSVALMGTAYSADLPYPVKAQPPTAPIVWSWAGPYIGLNLGATWNHAQFSDLGNPTNGNLDVFSPGDPSPFWSTSKADFALGGQTGYNWQTGNFVYGIEGDLNWVNGKASAAFAPHGFNVAATSNLDWTSTIRARAGLTFSQILFYATGGVGFAHFSDAWGGVSTGANTFTSSETRTGWVVGGGLEYMLTQNWTARIEGLYTDYGTKNVAVLNAGGLSGTYVSGFEHAVTTVRGALNWKW